MERWMARDIIVKRPAIRFTAADPLSHAINLYLTSSLSD